MAMAVASHHITFFISPLANSNNTHFHPRTKPSFFSAKHPLSFSPYLNPVTCFLLKGHTWRSNRCSATSTDESSSSQSSEISSAAKIRSEVLTPFRSVRMFFYLAFIASAGLGGLISLPRLISALTNYSARSQDVTEIGEGLAIDLGAVLLFAFLYSREKSAKKAQISRLSREERLSKLKLRVDEKRTIPISSLRGLARLVILAGPASFIQESFKRSEPFSEGLVERGVLVVPFASDGESIDLLDVEEEESDERRRRRRLWQLKPVNTFEWAKWIDEQKELAKVSRDSPVYLSLRMDGRVRGSGVGYPPWNAFVAQLPPVKGMWTGLLDGMDGRVL